MNEPENNKGGAVQQDDSDIFSAMNEAFPSIDENGTTEPLGMDGENAFPTNFDDDAPSKQNDGTQVKVDKDNSGKEDKEDKSLIEEADDFLNDSDEDKGDEFSEEKFDKETEELSKGMDAKAGDRFKALRQELKQYKQKQAEVKVPEDVQARIQELELKAAEAEGLRQQVEELSSVSAKVKVESSQEYKKKILEPAIGILQESEKIAEAHNVDPDIVQEIIKEQDRELQIELINAHLSEMNELEKQDLYRMIYEYKNLGKMRQEMLDKASEKLSQIEAQQIEEQKKALEEERKAVQQIQSSIWDKYKDVIPGFVNEDGETTEDWSKLRNRSLSMDFNKAGGKDKAYAAFAGVVLPHVIKELNNAKKKISELSGKDANELLRRPKLGQSAPEKPSDEDDFMTAMRKTRFKF